MMLRRKPWSQEPGARSGCFTCRFRGGSRISSCLLTPVSLPLLLLLCFAGIAPRHACAADSVTWRSGRDLQQFLGENIGGAGLAWSGQELREALATLSRSPGIRVAMMLDRRVDPQRRLNLAMGNVPFEEALSRIAKAADVALCQVGSVIYFGPPAITHRLRTVAELRKQDIRELPPSEARRFAALKPLAWDDFAEPRELLKAIAAEAGTTIENLDAVPHDLWGAVELPSMPVADRLSIVAAAYDLTFEIQPGGQTLRLVPIPERVAIKRSYPIGKAAADVAGKLSEVFRDCKIGVAGTRIEVEGRIEDQLQIAEAINGKPIRKPSVGGAAATGDVALDRLRIDAFTATNQPLGALIKEIARRLQLEAEFDGPALVEAKVSLDRLVSVELKSGSVKELLDKVMKPYGLDYEIEGKKLKVRPAAKKKT